MNVVITGASKGIGKAIAEVFAGKGAHLFLCARSEDMLKATAKQIHERYPESEVNTLAVDLSTKKEAIIFAEWCLKECIPDILVNNAGQYIAGNILDEPEESLEKMINTNLFSAYHITRKLVPAMIRNGGGHIFNMCSIASLHAYEGGGGYSVSKYALNGFSHNLRNELKPYNIKVTAIFPGAVMTDTWGNFDNSHNRIMEAKDIADLVLAASMLSKQAVVEEIIIRPQLGDL